MKTGYPCINRTVHCPGNKTFRLKSYSEDKLKETIDNNLNCLRNMLEFNVAHDLLFFRIGSDMVPFASHPVCEFSWQTEFSEKFRAMGGFIKEHGFRISMHPDQFVLINAKDIRIFQRSVKELIYHAQALDMMGLDQTAKIQIHVGGVYNDKAGSIRRFIERYHSLDDVIKKRLVIENDHRSYSLKDCMAIHKETNIPIVFDSLHHRVLNNGESMEAALKEFFPTWGPTDGAPMVDYSSQKPDAKKGNHALSIDMDDFSDFLSGAGALDFDIMLEIKDKEASALKAIERIRQVRQA